MSDRISKVTVFTNNLKFAIKTIDGSYIKTGPFSPPQPDRTILYSDNYRITIDQNGKVTKADTTKPVDARVLAATVGGAAGVKSPSVSVIDPPITPPVQGISIYPGESVQDKVNAYPGNTTFVLRKGLHLGQQVIPKTGDSFVGEPGAILNGGGSGPYYFITGMPGSIKNVTVKNLEICNYATPSRRGAIETGARGEAYNWIIEGCDIHHNSFIGIHADNGRGWKMLRNNIHHNGEIGLVASGADILLEGNELAFNNTGNYSSMFEAGGCKFVFTNNLVVRDNYSHDNKGPGLWTDINNYGVLYEGNRCINNFGAGIDHEVSYDAVIRNNIVEGNGFGWTGWVDGSGILITNSPNVEVYGNRVVGNNDGICAHQVARPDSGIANHGPWELRNLWVHDNLIAVSSSDGVAAGVVRNNSDPVFGWNNRWDKNTYVIPAHVTFRWDGLKSKAQWLALGQDLDSVWT